MNKIISVLLIIAIIFSGSFVYSADLSSTASVLIAGGIVKAQHVDNTKKYKRKDCPICLGKGYYISGDKITKVPCGYCIPDTKQPEPTAPAYSKPKVVVHPPIMLNSKPRCNDGSCTNLQR